MNIANLFFYQLNIKCFLICSVEKTLENIRDRMKKLELEGKQKEAKLLEAEIKELQKQVFH